MNNLITSKLKDEVLEKLLEAGTMSVQCQFDELASEINTQPDVAIAILDQFARMKLISMTKCMGGYAHIKIHAEAHDIYAQGGFFGQEQLIKANIEKLNNELELLAKKISPDYLDILNKCSGLANTVLSAFNLFKS